jgi:hypothetical protein
MNDVKARFHACPKCLEPVPFSRSMFGRGSPFFCQRCKTKIVASKVSVFHIVVLFLPLSLFGKRILELENGWLILVFLFVVSCLLEYLFLSVRLHAGSNVAK